jgi:hypothetical protein
MYLVYKILGIDDPTIKPDDSGMPQPGGNPKNFFGDFDLLKKHVAVREKAEVAQRRKGRREPLASKILPGFRMPFGSSRRLPSAPRYSMQSSPRAYRSSRSTVTSCREPPTSLHR